jgi:hypothetical protein
LLLHLPLALAIAAGCLFALTVFGWSRRSPARRIRVRDVTLVVMTVALSAQLAVWNLIGWGLS